MSGIKKILFVEDEDELRELTAGILKRNFYEVIVAAGGVQALELFQKHSAEIDLLVTDVFMPEMSGLDWVERVKSLYPEKKIKVLYLSGQTVAQIKDPRLLDSDSYFLEKPYTSKILIEQLKKILI